MCTGNSCRSIIAEALINAKLEGIKAFSAGTKPTGKINPNAKKVLENSGIWSEKYYSKNLDSLLDMKFSLVVTVCDSAKENCPIFPKTTEVLHVSFSDPDKKEYKEFEKTYKDIEKILLPKIKDRLCGKSL